MSRKRADLMVVEQGLAEDLREALALLLSGRVLAGTERIDKAGMLLDPSTQLQLKDDRRFVSRGGEKLHGALLDFGLAGSGSSPGESSGRLQEGRKQGSSNPAGEGSGRLQTRGEEGASGLSEGEGSGRRVSAIDGSVCLDLGASTGGFTDCLLQHGASKVYAVDVGKGQLDWKLRQDPRVEVRDEVNVRYLEPSLIPEPVDWVVADLSFISLRLVLPVLKAFAPLRLLVLVKPQFEAERQEVEAGGRIADESLRLEILRRLEDFCRQQGFTVESRADARISGRKSGNQETFFLLRIG